MGRVCARAQNDQVDGKGDTASLCNTHTIGAASAESDVAMALGPSESASMAMQTEHPPRKDAVVEAQLDGTPSVENAAAECIAAEAARRVVATCVAPAHGTAEYTTAEAAERAAAECVTAACGAAKCVAAGYVAAECAAAERVAAERSAVERDAAEHGAGLTSQPLSVARL